MIEIKEVFFNIEAQDFNQMIHKVSTKLIEKEYVNKEFEKNILERERKFPTGLLFGELAIAIPHTDPKYVKKSGIIAIKLNKPISMLHMATTDHYLKVSNFFILLVNEGKFQIDLLTELMEKFKNLKIQNKIKSLKNENQLMNIFK